MSSIEVGRRVLAHQAAALAKLEGSLGEAFATATEWILACKGRVASCGIGKSGAIARKVAGTLSSTGTPSFFLHAAEAVHGDLGMIAAGDVALLYTNSGETDELVRLFPSLRAAGAKTILVTGRPESSAGRLADLTLDTGVTAEACPNNLAPTTSTTAMLALSDALAIAVMEARGFGRDDFARLHPSGALGKRLLLTVEDAMTPLHACAIVDLSATVMEAMDAINRAGVGIACVVDEAGKLLGIIAFGDVRRHMLASKPIDAPVGEVMNRTFTSIAPDLLAVEAFEVFQNLPQKIGDIPVVVDDKLRGLLMLKDLLRSGLF